MRTSDASTRTPTTILRLSGPELRAGTVVEIRRTVRPSAADRALRCRDMASHSTQVWLKTGYPLARISGRATIPKAGRYAAGCRLRLNGPVLRPKQPVAPRGAAAVRAVDHLELLEAPARADRHAREGTLGEVDGDLRRVPDALVEPLQEGPASGEDDAPIHDVGGELRRRLVERRLHRVDDESHRLVERAPDLLGRDDHRLREARHHVAPATLGLQLLLQPVRRPDLELDLLGRLLADEELVLLLDVVDDRLVHLVAAHPHRLRDDDAAERDDRDLARSAADVDDHVSGRLGNREPGADRSRHRLLDEVRLTRTGGERRLLDRSLLHSGHPGRHADDDARMREPVLVHLLDEVPEHLLGDVEVGDDAVLQRTDGRDRPWRASEHPLRLDADRVHLAGALVDGDDGRLGEHDAAPAHVDERVGGAEIDGHVAASEPGDGFEPAHGGPESTWAFAAALARGARAARGGATRGVRRRSGSRPRSARRGGRRGPGWRMRPLDPPIRRSPDTRSASPARGAGT